MDAAGDEVTPIVVAQGSGEELLRREGPRHTLESDTTRADGLVSNLDVAPTILAYFGVPIPPEMDGEPIRPADASPPFALHRLHLEQRSTRLGIQFGEIAFVALAALLGAWALIVEGRPGTLSMGTRRAIQSMCVLAVSLPVSLLVAGLLPHRSYAWSVPAILTAMGVLTFLALRREGPDSLRPFTFLATIALILFAVDLTVGGLALRVPLFGGSMFDGARFYGLPNGYFAFLLGSALLAAAALPPYPGFVLVMGAGLVAGFPSLGADIGGAVTLFAAGGLWLVLRTRRRVRGPEVALVGTITVAGLSVVLLVNRFLPGTPTHATRFVERSVGSPKGAFDVITDRLDTGFAMIRDVPVAVLPLISVVVILALVIRRVGSVGRGMELDPRWPAFVVTVCVASLVAYFANDTGAAAADPALVYAMAGITYPAMLAGRAVDPGPVSVGTSSRSRG